MPALRSGASRPASVAVLTVFIGTLVAYCATAARYVRWGDSPEFVTVAHTLGIAHPPGYPLYTLLSALAVRIPLGEPFFRLSLLSALFGAAAAATLAALAWQTARLPLNGALSGPAFFTWRPGTSTSNGGGGASGLLAAASALLAGLTFAFSPTVWSQAVVPEVYTLSALLLLLLILLLTAWVRRSMGGAWSRDAGSQGSDPGSAAVPAGHASAGAADRLLPAMGLALGLALAHHLTAVLVVPSIAIVLLTRRPGPGRVRWAAAAGLMLVGLSLYAYLPLRAAHDPAVLWTPINTFSDLCDHVTGAQYAPLLFSAPLLEVRHKIALFLAGLPREMSLPVLLLSAVGLIGLWRSSRPLAAAVLLWPCLVVAHAAVYRIPDIASYYIPVYGAVALMAGHGLVTLLRLPRLSGRAGFVLGVAATALALSAGVFAAARHWSAQDLSRADAGKTYLDRLLSSVGSDGIVVTMTDRVLFPMWYARFVEGRRPDIAVASVREHAPHLSRWFPGVRFPSEQEFAARSVVPPSASPRRQVASARVGNYLPLLNVLNAPRRPLCADADLARRVFPERSVPRGLLVTVSPSRVDSVGTIDSQLRFWEQVERELSEGDDAEAVNVYAKSLTEQGMLFIERGDTRVALAILERAARMAPEEPLCLNNLGVAYEQAGRLEESMAQFEAAIHLDPVLAPPHYNIHRLASRLGDHARAREELETAVALAPDEAFYRVELALLLESSGDVRAAERMFRLAIELSPEDWGAKLAFGDFLARHRRFSEAVAAYEYAAELRPGAPDALKGLSRCYWALDDREKAMSVMSRLVELQPNNVVAKYDLALMLHRSGRPHEALPLLDDVMRILPTMWEAAAYKAGVLAELGRLWEARAIYDRAAELGASGEAFEKARSSVEERIRGGPPDEVAD